MFAGKTSELMRVYRAMGSVTSIAIKPAMDTRYSAHEIVSHADDRIPATPLHNLQNIEKIVGEWQTNVFIDEGQFFMDLAEKTGVLLSMGKSVWISGLNATARQRPWPSMSDVMAMADDIVYVRAAACHLCGRGPGCHTISHALEAAASSSGTNICIGGDEMYAVVCRECLHP
jgi:thymidine kinase